MTFVKNHLALILPLFAILFAIEYLLIFDRTLRIYEEGLKEQYSVILVAEREVKPSTVRNASILVQSVEAVDEEAVLKRIRRQLHRDELQKLRDVLPRFYTVKLRRYPSGERLEKLKKELSGVKGVKRVQVFEKVHDRLYGTLLFMKSNFYVFGALTALIGFLLVLKQMHVWQLEHKERMQIMALFGAPVWLRSGTLFKLAFVDAFVAVVLVFVGMEYLLATEAAREVFAQMGIDPSSLLGFDDLLWLSAAGFGIAFFCAAWVVMRFREEL